MSFDLRPVYGPADICWNQIGKECADPQCDNRCPDCGWHFALSDDCGCTISDDLAPDKIFKIFIGRDPGEAQYWYCKSIMTSIPYSVWVKNPNR